MPDRLAARLPCPVCLAGKMAFITIRPEPPELVLDHCQRCGGVWFDDGEVAALRAMGPSALLTRVRPRRESFRMRCRHCDAFIDRDRDRCPACDRAATLDCPRCDTPLRAVHAGGVRLDTCGRCRGIWLDNHELKEIWKLGYQRTPIGARAVDDGNGVAALDVLLYGADGAFYAAHGVGHVLAAGAEVAGPVVGALEALGAAAEAVFEAILAAVSAIS